MMLLNAEVQLQTLKIRTRDKTSELIGNHPLNITLVDNLYFRNLERAFAIYCLERKPFFDADRSAGAITLDDNTKKVITSRSNNFRSETFPEGLNSYVFISSNVIEKGELALNYVLREEVCHCIVHMILFQHERDIHNIYGESEFNREAKARLVNNFLHSDRIYIEKIMYWTGDSHLKRLNLKKTIDGLLDSITLSANELVALVKESNDIFYNTLFEILNLSPVEKLLLFSQY